MKFPHLLPLWVVVCTALSAGAHAEQSYSVSIEGAPNGLKNKLEIISDLKKGVRDYPTQAALRRAARRDQKAFDEALQAAGFYTGKAAFELKPSPDKDETIVAFVIDTGPAFQIVEYEILYRDGEDGLPMTLDEAGIKTDGSAAGADLRTVQTRVLNHLWESGYPQAAIVGRVPGTVPQQSRERTAGAGTRQIRP